MIRCKLRCLERTEKYDNTWMVRLAPVIAKSECSPEGCVENRAYYKWTPAGEVALNYLGGASDNRRVLLLP